MHNIMHTYNHFSLQPNPLSVFFSIEKMDHLQPVTSEEMAEYSEKVSMIRQKTVADKSRHIYQGSHLKFLTWLFVNRRDLLVPQCASEAAAAPDIRQYFKSILQNAPSNPPIFFDQLTARDFLIWIVSLKKKDGTSLGKSSYDSHRSSLWNLFRDFGHVMSKEVETGLKDHFVGLKRDLATRIKDGNAEIKVGKDPLSFSLYRFLGLALLKVSNRDHLFARCFMVLSWNLLARASSAFSICHSHMSWVEDSLLIFFSQMKCDQAAERPRDPRHVYANPLMPEVCPILALAMYWSCFDFIPGENHLFEGSNQYERFRKILARTLNMDSIALELERRAVNSQDLGTHSMRKGASTYCSSGSTSCPSSVAIHLRAGWTLGGVQDTYLRYESAGDMFVGRTVSGLPVNSPEFSILPPLFRHIDGMFLKHALQLVFPNMPHCLHGIGEKALASLVYHSDYLKNNLSTDHPIFSSAVFRNTTLLSNLKECVICSLPKSGETISATGIPAHVSILASMKEISDSLVQNIAVQNQNVVRIVEGVLEKLEEKAIGLGTVTTAGLSDAIMKCLEEGGVMRIVRALENPVTNAAGIPAPASNNGNQPIAYHWGGRIQLLPEGFQFPAGGVLEAWRFWCCGDQSKGYPALKSVNPEDLPTTNHRKRFCDLKFLMNKIEERAKDLGLEKSQMSEMEAIETYNACKDVVEISATTLTGKKRRTGQITWMTVVNNLRKKLRRDDYVCI